MAVKIVSCNEKGGVGKTTLVYCLGTILASKGYKVLLIDLDPQGDLNIVMNVNHKDFNIYDILMKEKDIKVKSVAENLYHIPGSRKMYDFEIDYHHKFPKTQKEMAVKRLLNNFEEKVDFVFIDCPPNIKSIYVDNAFMAGDYVLMPVEAQPTSYAGVEMVLEIIDQFNEDWNPTLKPIGIVMNQVDIRTNVYRGVRKQFEKKWGNLLMDTVIRDVTAIKEVNAIANASIQNIDQIKLDRASVKILKKNNGLIDYEQLADEIITKVNIN